MAQLRRQGTDALVWRAPARAIVDLQSPRHLLKPGQSPFLRELIIPFARSGCVALFEIVGSTDAVVSAVRHQLEEDYH